MIGNFKNTSNAANDVRWAAGNTGGTRALSVDARAAQLPSCLGWPVGHLLCARAGARSRLFIVNWVVKLLNFDGEAPRTGADRCRSVQICSAGAYRVDMCTHLLPNWSDKPVNYFARLQTARSNRAAAQRKCTWPLGSHPALWSSISYGDRTRRLIELQLAGSCLLTEGQVACTLIKRR